MLNQAFPDVTVADQFKLLQAAPVFEIRRGWFGGLGLPSWIEGKTTPGGSVGTKENAGVGAVMVTETGTLCGATCGLESFTVMLPLCVPAARVEKTALLMDTVKAGMEDAPAFKGTPDKGATLNHKGSTPPLGTAVQLRTLPKGPLLVTVRD